MAFPRIRLPPRLTAHHAECGRRLLALHFALRAPARAETLARPETASLLAWACRLPAADQFYQYVGHLAETRGLDAAAGWVADVYRPFMPSEPAEAITRSDTAEEPASTGAAEPVVSMRSPVDRVSSTSTSVDPTNPEYESFANDLGLPGAASRTEARPQREASGAQELPPGLAAELQAGLEDALGDPMDLFDSETWLTESPIAQQMWREAEK